MTNKEAINLLDNLLGMVEDNQNSDYDTALKMAIEALKQPERKKGRWIRHDEIKNIYGGICIECSECGEKYVVQHIEREKYCRECGADMREGGQCENN